MCHVKFQLNKEEIGSVQSNYRGERVKKPVLPSFDDLHLIRYTRKLM